LFIQVAERPDHDGEVGSADAGVAMLGTEKVTPAGVQPLG
jgi:hypothetical protein